MIRNELEENKAILIVAKLDRLLRDVGFTSALFKGGVEFICCDNPNVNKLTIQLLSVIAEHEVVVISKRMKDALRVKKDKIAFLNTHTKTLFTKCEGMKCVGVIFVSRQLPSNQLYMVL